MAAKVLKNNYSAGELDPRLYDRADLPQHKNGAEKLTNCALLPQGGFRRRDGSEFLQELLPKITLLSAGITVTTPNSVNPPPDPAADGRGPFYSDRSGRRGTLIP